MLRRNKGKSDRAVFIDQDELDAEYEESVKRLEQIDREDQKSADKFRKVEEAQKKRDAERAELAEGVRRHEEEQQRLKAKKEAEALAKQGSPPAAPPVVTIPPASDPDADITVAPRAEPENKVREELPVATAPSVIDAELSTVQTTENVVQPIIGREPSTAFKTPWSKTDRPWHGLSMNGYAGDVHCDAGTFGKIASIGGTLRGFKHQVPDRATGAAGQNEDWFSTFCAVSSTGTKYVVSVVCDGLSSAPYSWYGARRTSTSLARDVAEGINLLVDVNSKTLQKIVDDSLATQAATLMTWKPAEYGAPQIDPSTVDPVALGCTVTLTVVCAEPDQNGVHSIVAGNVGDSPVFNLSGGEWRKVSPPDLDSGDILDTKTHAFPRHTECVLVDDSLKQGECVLMTSDGVGNFILRNGMTLALGSYLSTRWNSPVGILSFLNQLNFDLPTADDDRTAVAFWPA